MALTDTAIRAAKPAEKPYKISDAKGLYLYVQPNGSKLWRLAYRFNGKQLTLSLGAYGKAADEVPLEAAREASRKAKALLKEGIDPGQQRKLDRIAAATAAADTFNILADDYISKLEREGNHAPQTLEKTRWLIDLARPDLGNRPISQITAPEVLATLRKVEARGKFETARRMRSTLSRVFRLAIWTARGTIDPCEALAGALTTPPDNHFAAVTKPAEFGALLRAVWDYEGQPEVVAALKLMAYLFPRPGELRQAEWSEFDLDKAVWTIPEARMKMRRPFAKPLPTQAVVILRDLHKLNGDISLVFPGLRSRRRCISENTLNAALRRMGYTKDQATAHGFRSTASTMLNQSDKWAPDWIEVELSHKDGDRVRGIYNRADYWGMRVKMLQWWANECDRLRNGAEIVPMAGEAARMMEGTGAA